MNTGDMGGARSVRRSPSPSDIPFAAPLRPRVRRRKVGCQPSSTVRVARPSHVSFGGLRRRYWYGLFYSPAPLAFRARLITCQLHLAAAMMAGVGRRSIMKLAQRMTLAFCAGVVRRPAAAAAGEWSAVEQAAVEEEEEAVRVSMRKSVKEAGEPPGVVLSASTAVWLPVAPRRLFDFLRDAGFRCRWDILSNGGPVYEMGHVATSANDSVNAVSLLRSTVCTITITSIFFSSKNYK